MKKHLLLIASLTIIGLTGCGSNQQQSNTSSSITGSSSSTPSSSSTSQEIPTTQYYISKADIVYEDGDTICLEINYDESTRTLEETATMVSGQYTAIQSYKFIYNEKNLCTYVKETSNGKTIEKYGEYNSDNLLTKIIEYYNGELDSTMTIEYDNLKRITKISDPEYNTTFTYTYYDDYALETYQYYSGTTVTKVVTTINEVQGTKTESYYKVENSNEVFDYSVVYDIESNLVIGMTSTSKLNGYMTLNENKDPLKIQWEGSTSIAVQMEADFNYKNDGTLDYILSSNYDSNKGDMIDTKTYFTHDANGNVIEEKMYEIENDVENLYVTSTYEIKEFDGNTFLPIKLVQAVRKGNYINCYQRFYNPADFVLSEGNPIKFDYNIY